MVSRTVDTPTIARYEFKYAIPHSLLDPIRQFIQGYCALDQHAAPPDGFYSITSLYLDDHRFQSFRDTDEGKPDRFKLRIRTYGTACDGPVNFEVKHRINGAIVKSTVKFPGPDWTRFFQPCAAPDVERLPSPQRTALEKFLLLTRKFRAVPKMLVRYERLAFRSRTDQYVRVTFDRRLVHQTMPDYDLEGDSSRWRPIDDEGYMGKAESSLVLELKFMNRPPRWLEQLTRCFGLVRRGCSKYAGAVRRSVFQRELAWDRAPVPNWSIPYLPAPSWSAPGVPAPSWR